MADSLYSRLTGLVYPAAWRRKDEPARSVNTLIATARALPDCRSQTRALTMATEILDSYAALDEAGKLRFFRALRDDFDPDTAKLSAAARAYAKDPGPATLPALTRLSEPPRQELLRRLNAARLGTVRLVNMRADLLRAMKAGEDLARVDDDFRHLLRSWFNPGFLRLVRIDWKSPALLLEKLIAYEAVHEIHGFKDLQLRVLPPDRRCYAYMHPAMPDEPLIFVEIALTPGLPGSVQALIDEDREPIEAEQADTAVFYSISNCQAGLAGISFGNLLIKQVVAELARDLPNLSTFVTLSPIPGLRRWLQDEAAAGAPWAQAWAEADLSDATEIAARYLLSARDARGRPRDPVARFHLGNGAEAHRIIARADTSPRGRNQSLGMMVNYLYDLPRIEARHDAFAVKGTIAASRRLSDLAKKIPPAGTKETT